ncbi:NADP-dependent oxidoreductase [Diaminobutyricibacter tongyongensis]|uniref:NADP-dependent oxidoreductase n=1 Tax=Leifsonia tongyongensis TaxID=1268043 RepID=A0A6L9Y1B7_9MICO|nr:NADP-dependent oxidoreductase [Diaminobutyricibacter tongyongensis]NEN07460.1 NADP-dependent oxidoreductase [Diaminobutyricibacter tongyongensis]
MSRFVQFEEYGPPENLKVVNVQPPWPGPGEVRVRVMAVGLNAVDYKAMAGGPAVNAFGLKLPSGIGYDFSGFVDEVGAGVTRYTPGDAVLGSKPFEAAADFVIVAEDGQLIPKPAALTFEVAGALGAVGRTAMASVASLELDESDTVLVSAAAGGVGVLACQLAIRAGATVIGTASAANHDYLSDLGVIPVEYGEGLADRIRESLHDGQPLTAALDNHGPETIDVAIELGVPVERINTIAAYGPAARGAAHVGGSRATNDHLAEIAELLAQGELVLPIDSIFPIERAAEAYRRLAAGHVRGKVILVTD